MSYSTKYTNKYERQLYSILLSNVLYFLLFHVSCLNKACHNFFSELFKREILKSHKYGISYHYKHVCIYNDGTLVIFILCVFLSFSLSVMKQDNESNGQRDEGMEENSYEDNRAIFYLLH